ncbi:MAG TPA: DUF1592 domain-containing protein, partial [Polyangiaceae bacterium]|nr:DUF1592 domain-containing protein [Polyangiaceae bacterium]
HFGPRALRRPLSDELSAQLMNAFQVGAADGFDSGVRLVIETALQSPFFLYHIELPPEGAGGLVRLDPYSLASRLSFFLWRSMPDDVLFEAAASGGLDSRDGLRAQAERMLADDRAARAITGFHMQWLGLRDFEQLEKDPAVFPAFDGAMRTAMRQETERFTDWVLRKGDGSLAALLTGAYSFPTGPLAALYGVNESGTEPVDLDASERAGVLTHASFLAMHSHPDQTSPVHRGVIVRENILCQTLPPPPENVDNVAPEPDPSLTTRERFAVHTQDPSCAACHQLIDGIGFGFERYDAVGAYRATENDKPVDASGNVVGTNEGDIAFDGAVELGSLLADSPTVHACLVRQWFRYAFGRMEGEHDKEQLTALDRDFEASEQNVRALLLAVVESDAFSYLRAESTP